MSEMGWGMFELALLFFFLFVLAVGGLIVYSIAKTVNDALKKRRNTERNE